MSVLTKDNPVSNGAVPVAAKSRAGEILGNISSLISERRVEDAVSYWKKCCYGIGMGRQDVKKVVYKAVMDLLQHTPQNPETPENNELRLSKLQCAIKAWKGFFINTYEFDSKEIEELHIRAADAMAYAYQKHHDPVAYSAQATFHVPKEVFLRPMLRAAEEKLKKGRSVRLEELRTYLGIQRSEVLQLVLRYIEMYRTQAEQYNAGGETEKGSRALETARFLYAQAGITGKEWKKRAAQRELQV
ncbi:MAG TPA: hypothetical protein VL945_01600 [Candidatus Saccharimonadales bacterium]|nr:hypothetical protein [Candidatus Saccharimonadales bacterium]